MAYQIFYTEGALIDLESILEPIRVDNAQAAERLGTALLAHVDLLRHFPKLGPSVPHHLGVRKLLHTPVNVYYRVMSPDQVVQILHFWHSSRKDPIL